MQFPFVLDIVKGNQKSQLVDAWGSYFNKHFINKVIRLPVNLYPGININMHVKTKSTNFLNILIVDDYVVWKLL